MIALLLGACAPPAGPVWGAAGQPAIQASLIVHVDPLPRQGGDCATDGLSACGGPNAEAWQKRTENLSWLAETWTRSRRTVDLELGPESSRGWSGDPEIAAALADHLGRLGDPDGAATVAAVAAEGRVALGALVSSGAATLGVHVHNVLPDGGGRVGDAIRRTDGPGPCAAWEEDPTPEDPAAEAVLAYGVSSALPLAEALGVELRSFTGHLPRSMAGKIAVVDDPDSLDPDVKVGFDPRFAPVSLGSAYSECLHTIVDHPPFEPWPAHDSRALAAGDGPLVIPGERVIGTMEEHLEVWADTAGPAARRRLWELLLNWRVAALSGEEARPWVWTYHTHDFQLNPGSPDPRAADARALKPVEGNALRGDLLEVAELIDELRGLDAWQGLALPEEGLFRWTPVDEMTGAGSRFDLGVDGEGPAALTPADSPYLPLLAEALADSHQLCAGWSPEGVQILGFGVCAAGWAWGGDASGFHCVDGGEPVRRYVLIPAVSGCRRVPGLEGSAAAPVDGEAWDSVPSCGPDALELPAQGLLVEATAPWVACTEGG